MKFIKFIIVYLLLFTSFIAFRLSYLEPEALYAYALAIGGVSNLLVIFSSFLRDGSESDSSVEDIDV